MKQNLLTVSAAARMKKVSRQTVYKAIEREELQSLSADGPPVLREADVKQWTPQKAGGRRNTSPMSEETKEKLSVAQKRRWSERKKTESGSEQL